MEVQTRKPHQKTPPLIYDAAFMAQAKEVSKELEAWLDETFGRLGKKGDLADKLAGVLSKDIPVVRQKVDELVQAQHNG